MAVTAAELMVRVGADTSDAERGIASFRSGLNATAADLGRSGAYLTAGITTPLVGAGVAAVKFSTDFNAAMANVASLGLAPERVLELKGNIQEMAVEVGKSTNDLADGMYQVVSAFGDSSDSLEILEINARAAAAGLATTTDAINLTSAVTKGYGDTSAEALQHVADLAFKTVEMGQTTFPELASSMGKVVPLAVELGISQEELFAVMATGTGVTGNASEVVTQLRSSMQALMSPTGSMTDLIEDMGFASGKAMIEQLGYHGSILAITQAAEASGKPLGDFMGRVEGQVLALALAGPQADVYTEKLAAMGDASGAVDDAFRAQTEGINATGFAMRNAGIRAEILMQKLGDGIAPAIDRVLALAEPLVGWVEGLVDTFTRADEGTQLMVVGLAAFAAAIGPVMLGLAGMAAALAFLLTPIGAVVAAVAALGAVWITDFGGIRTAVMGAIDTVSGFVNDLIQQFTRARDAGLDPLRAAVFTIQNLFESWNMQWASNLIGDIETFVRSLVSNFNQARENGLAPFRAAIFTLQNMFESWNMRRVSDALGDFETAMWSAIRSIMTSFIPVMAFGRYLVNIWNGANRMNEEFGKLPARLLGFAISAGLVVQNLRSLYDHIRDTIAAAPNLQTGLRTLATQGFDYLQTRITALNTRLIIALVPLVAGYQRLKDIIAGLAAGDLEPAKQALTDTFEAIRNFDISAIIQVMAGAAGGIRDAIVNSFNQLDLPALRDTVISKLGLDNFKLFPEGADFGIGSLPADLGRVSTALRHIAVAAAEFVGIDLSTITFDFKGLQTAIIQQLNLIDFAVIAIGLRLKVQGALRDISWDDIALNVKALQTAIIQQFNLINFGIIAIGLRLKVTKAFQDLTWDDVKVGAGDLKAEIIRQLADVDFTQIATGLRLKAQNAFQGIAWDTLPPIDVEPLRLMLQTNVDNAQSKLAAFFGTDNVLTRSITRITETINIISDLMAGAASLAPAERFNRVVSSVVAALTTIQSIEYDVLQTATRHIARLAVSLMAFSTSIVDNVDAEAVAGVLRDIVNEFTTQLSALVDADTLTSIGTAAGKLISSFVDKLGEVLSAEGFAESVGSAVGKATVALAEGATALVTGIAGQLALVNWGEFSSNITTFVTGFVDGVTTELANADWSGIAKAIATGILNSFRNANPFMDDATHGAAREGIQSATGIDIGQNPTWGDLEATLNNFAWPELPEFAWPEFTWPDFTWPEFTWPTFAWPEFTWPTFPEWTWPTLPDFAWPSLPEFTWPEMPEFAWPTLPEWVWPTLPTWRWPTLPVFTWPVLPVWTWPSLPTWTWPSIPRPGWLDTFSNLIDRLLSWNPFGGASDAPANAQGRSHFEGGLTWVGEQGRELVRLPRGSTIFSNKDSEAMAGSNGITVQINGPITVANGMDIEQLAHEVARKIKNHRR